MRLKQIVKASIGLLLVITLVACSSNHSLRAPEVAINPNQKVKLPMPGTLGYNLKASQLITATWSQEGVQKSEQLPVQLQVDNESIVLAGFSSWGTRILSLTYDGIDISTNVLPGLDGKLPAPEQVLFNLMITLWPTASWEPILNEINWKIIEDTHSRSILIVEEIKSSMYNIGTQIGLRAISYFAN